MHFSPASTNSASLQESSAPSPKMAVIEERHKKRYEIQKMIISIKRAMSADIALFDGVYRRPSLFVARPAATLAIFSEW